MGCRGDAAENASGEQHQQRIRQRHDQEIHRQHEQRNQQHRLAPKPVRQIADGRAEQKLHHRIGKTQISAPDRRAADARTCNLLDQVRQHWNDDAKTHGVDDRHQQHEDYGAPPAISRRCSFA